MEADTKNEGGKKPTGLHHADDHNVPTELHDDDGNKNRSSELSDSICASTTTGLLDDGNEKAATIYRGGDLPSGELRESLAAKLSPEEGIHYTYADYCTWDDDTRWELIDGVPYAMSAPVRVHQEISGELYVQFYNFLKGKPCKVYYAPFDVRLNADGADDTVVQPDLLVVCDQSKLDDKGCKGAPDLMVEILSPSTAGYDRVVKLRRYLLAGIREYWIVDPGSKTVEVCLLQGGQYIVSSYGADESIAVSVLPGLEISLPDVFRQ